MCKALRLEGAWPEEGQAAAVEGVQERHAEEEGPCSAGQPLSTDANSEFVVFVGLEPHGLPLLTCPYLSSSWCLSRLHTAPARPCGLDGGITSALTTLTPGAPLRAVWFLQPRKVGALNSGLP